MEGVRLSQDIVHLEALAAPDTKTSVEGDMLSEYCKHNGIETAKEFTATQIARIYKVKLASANAALAEGHVDHEAAEMMLRHRMEVDPDFELGA